MMCSTMGMDYKTAKAAARKLLDKHGLHDWGFSWENLRNPLFTHAHPEGLWGTCDLENMVIRVDYRVGRGFRQTVLHEIAHAKNGKSGHGKDWIMIASDVGVSSVELLRYALLDLEKQKDLAPSRVTRRIKS
jgi:hypothetical protein